MCRKTSTSIAAVGDGVAVAGGPQLSGRADVDFLSRTQWWNWYEPNTTKAEKRLIFKLDVFILSYTCLSFFVKYLDQTSITNAFVTGMQQALKIDNNELNWLTTYYNIGIIVGAPFFTFGLTVVPPRYWLPGSTLIMALFVLSMFRAENIQALYGLRFCAGLFASGIQPGSYYIIGSWYRKSEISRRSGIFTISSIAGGMLSGPIQSGLVNNIRDRGAIAAWQWLFILDAIISIPVAIFGIIGCPDEPRSEKIWWMTETEREIAIHRLKTEGRDSESTLELSVLKRIFTSWQYYIFPLAYWCVYRLIIRWPREASP
ncbi:MFS general substrate transporter [Dissoconium aciculare CBS 342.82]|uniref:MFS general substrate transporter n=1 Tax=Dissoconium aciculare CBS 342.82 TaxID=1314786 RepID=A0A6J3MDR4_9PEZI|nr:MFS general substrate transporter [Dissoconium aciculare CBS 342.82]KAF1825744.1 MFS general substrate transporter [Dissoconium aciculare CBS 342.82]